MPNQIACCGEMTTSVAGGMVVDAIYPYFGRVFCHHIPQYPCSQTTVVLFLEGVSSGAGTV